MHAEGIWGRGGKEKKGEVETLKVGDKYVSAGGEAKWTQVRAGFECGGWRGVGSSSDGTVPNKGRCGDGAIALKERECCSCRGGRVLCACARVGECSNASARCTATSASTCNFCPLVSPPSAPYGPHTAPTGPSPAYNSHAPRATCARMPPRTTGANLPVHVARHSRHAAHGAAAHIRQNSHKIPASDGVGNGISKSLPHLGPRRVPVNHAGQRK